MRSLHAVVLIALVAWEWIAAEDDEELTRNATEERCLLDSSIDTRRRFRVVAVPFPRPIIQLR